MSFPPGRMAFGGSGTGRGLLPGGGVDSHQELISRTGARFLPIWNGKPLISQQGSLCWLARGHDCLEHALEEPVHLGELAAAPRFASDISAWLPAENVPVEPDAILDQSEQIHPAAPAGSRFVNLRSVMTLLSSGEAELAARAKSLLGWHARHRFCANCGGESRMSAAGWQRKCGNCEIDHFCRTDPVVIMLITSGNSVLLGRAQGWPPRMYSLLAGFIEPGETIEAAVRRETFEETGVRVGKVNYVASQPWPFPSSLMMGCAGAAESTAITLEPDELAAACWLTREEMLDICSGTDAEIAPPRPGTIAEYLIWLWLSGRPV